MDLNILTYLGIMLLAALIAGKIVKQMRLPNVTGYLVIGLLIGPNCLKILSEELIDSINICQFDYVVDACDSVETKALLMGVCVSKNIKIISSMGTAKKMDATKLSITTLDKTNYDKLAKKLRSVVPKNIQRKIKVVSSTEQVKDINVLGSNSFVPATSGLLITNYIINDVANS